MPRCGTTHQLADWTCGEFLILICHKSSIMVPAGPMPNSGIWKSSLGLLYNYTLGKAASVVTTLTKISEVATPTESLPGTYAAAVTQSHDATVAPGFLSPQDYEELWSKRQQPKSMTSTTTELARESGVKACDAHRNDWFLPAVSTIQLEKQIYTSGQL